MRKEWATLGLDLHLELGGSRKQAGLEAALREGIRDGRLPAGSRLPSSRTLAGDLGVARNTVADAYAQLAAEGWLAGRHGSGTWVAVRSSAETPALTALGEQEPAHHFDLRPGIPDLAAFPRTAWLAAARRSLAAASPSVMSYGDARGLAQLRTTLAGYLGRARGVATSPDRIVIVPGLAYGLELVCRLLKARGAATLATEVYGLRLHRHIVQAAGMHSPVVPVDSSGAAFNEIGNADAVLLTPGHQFPTGVPLAPERRRQVVDWAAATGAFIIEDDYDGEFRYDRQSIGALQALSPERVVYAGTASKSLVPGLRLAWLALPKALAEEFLATRTLAPLCSSLEQLTLAELISSGAFDRQVRQRRLAYGKRRDRLIAALAREVPRFKVAGVAAGLQALLLLPVDESEDETVEQAREQGLMLEGLHAYTAEGHVHPPALVIGYARPTDHTYDSALARLCAVLRSSAGRRR